MTAKRLRVIGWAAMGAAAFALIAVATFGGGGAETDAERIQRLSESFACPQCRGESVADSNAAVAATIRRFIAQEVTAGATDTEIRDDLLAAYQTSVLLTPPADGLASLLWILPVVLAVGGAAAVTTMATRTQAKPVVVSDADLQLVSKARQAWADAGNEEDHHGDSTGGGGVEEPR
ncbi:MAG: cytochrome c-type biogenesis protein CcmH [Actinomycetia bacterium]|nr:cytochrome c-type biogenesis protein CcmH [Actinomycetes bacterium]